MSGVKIAKKQAAGGKASGSFAMQFVPWGGRSYGSGWMGVGDKRRCLRRGTRAAARAPPAGPEGPRGGFRISPLRSLWTPITPLKRFLAGACCPLPEGPPPGMAHLRMRDMVKRKHSSRLRRRMRLQTNIHRQQVYSSALCAKNTASNDREAAAAAAAVVDLGTAQRPQPPWWVWAQPS